MLINSIGNDFGIKREYQRLIHYLTLHVPFMSFNRSIIFIACLLGVFTVTLADGSTRIKFESANKKIKLIYTRGEAISIDVYTQEKSVFTMSLSEDNGRPEVEFVELNSDGLQDIIIRLEDESGFELLILLSKPKTDSYLRALATKSIKVDYSNLETEVPGKLHTAYDIKIDKIGEKILMFHHLYIGQTLRHKAVLRLNDSKTDYFIHYTSIPLR